MLNSEYAAEVTWERAMPVWWAFFWRVAVYTTILGTILGLIGGLAAGVAGRPDLPTSMPGCSTRALRGGLMLLASVTRVGTYQSSANDEMPWNLANRV